MSLISIVVQILCSMDLSCINSFVIFMSCCWIYRPDILLDWICASASFCKFWQVYEIYAGWDASLHLWAWYISTRSIPILMMMFITFIYLMWRFEIHPEVLFLPFVFLCLNSFVLIFVWQDIMIVCVGVEMAFCFGLCGGFAI